MRSSPGPATGPSVPSPDLGRKSQFTYRKVQVKVVPGIKRRIGREVGGSRPELRVLADNVWVAFAKARTGAESW